MKHTPGKWKVNEHIFGEYFADIEGRDSDCPTNDKQIRTIAVILKYASKEECKANARLIAAAPELLEACKKALNNLRKQRVFATPTKAVEFMAQEKELEQSIAKAEGKE